MVLGRCQMVLGRCQMVLGRCWMVSGSYWTSSRVFGWPYEGVGLPMGASDGLRKVLDGPGKGADRHGKVLDGLSIHLASVYI